jgi:hypothetical protein
MEPLAMCWMFDKRWFCGLQNRLYFYLFAVPITANLLTIVGMIVERSHLRVEVGQLLILLLTLSSLLAVGSLYLLLRTHVAARQQMASVTENEEAIREFTSSL